jgi:type II secretory pathway predicted ATPase ExeA
MYLDHFQIKEKPFLLNTDPRFLWLGTKHYDALKILEHGIKENKGLLLLTGEIGSGKTMLISALVSRLNYEEIAVARLPDPGLERREFFFLVARNFGIGRRVFSRESFTEAIDRFLSTLYIEEKKALLIVDEAQIMTSSILEEIRLLSNIEYQHKKLFNIFLVGQNEFNIILLKPEHRSLKERISTSYNLELLSESETAAYISHRLKIAGAKSPIFTDNAMREIHLFSNGSPRQINIISDIALVYGIENDKTLINREIIQACKNRVRVPAVSGGPLPDEPLFEETKWQPPEEYKDTPDPVVLLNRTVRRMSWYSILALMILLPCGYMLYSDRGRAYLAEKIPFIKRFLPASSLPYPSRSSSLTPPPVLSIPSNNEQKAPSMKSGLDSEVIQAIKVTASSEPDQRKKQPITQPISKVSTKNRRDAAEVARPSAENKMTDKDILKTSALPAKSKDVKKKPPPRSKKAAAVKSVATDLSSKKPETELINAPPPSSIRPVKDKTDENPSSKESASVSLSENPKNRTAKPTDSERTLPENPDPRDIIDWLLKEKEKSPSQNQP